MCTGTVGRPLQRENEGTGGHCFYRNVKARHSMSVRRECRGARRPCAQILLGGRCGGRMKVGAGIFVIEIERHAIA
ncbi:hypothetical protein FKM82_001368 [Ascaphus truei]